MENHNIHTTDEELATIMKALGHPVRVSIIRKIIEKSKCPCGCNPCSCGDRCEDENCKCGCKCGELVDLFPMAQSTVSQHLKELKNAGIINMNGRKGDYTLNHKKLMDGLNQFQLLLGFGGNALQETHCCCQSEEISDNVSEMKICKSIKNC